MSTTTAQQRRGKAQVKSDTTTAVLSPTITRLDGTVSSTTATSTSLMTETMHPAHPALPPIAPTMAVVHRRFCGTGPYDKHWLNLDCCGLFCAFLPYCLHLYGIYAKCFILLPPWMSYTVEQERILACWGQWHRFFFTTIAILAMVAHFQAMTTDPGAVPPDARPLDEDLQQLQ